MNVAGWDVDRELANEGDVRRYEVTHADGRRGILQIAAAGSAAAAQFQAASGALDRGVDPFGNPYAVHPIATAPAPPVVASARPVVASAPQRISKQTTQTIVTLLVVAAIGGGIALYLKKSKNAATAAQSLRTQAVLPVGSIDGRIGCLHPAGLCESTFTSSYHRIDRIEVTWGEWKKCVDAGACSSIASSGAVDEPVTNVSWDQAQTFCTWKTGKLPEDESWEAIARSKEARRYPWGDEQPTCDRANTRGCDGKPTAAKRPNGASAGGVEDMAGNVAEWVERKNERFSKDPPKTRAARGGSFARPTAEAAAAGERVVEGGAAQPDIGFRCYYDSIEMGTKTYDERQRVELLVSERIQKQPAIVRPKTTFAVTASVTEKRGDTNYVELVTTALTAAGLEAAPGGVSIAVTCKETAYGEFSYSSFSTSGSPGTKIECELALSTPSKKCTSVKVEGSTGSGDTSLYGGAVDEVKGALAIKALGALVALCGGDETAAAETARISWLVAQKFLGDGTGFAKAALERADSLPPNLRAEAYVANRDPVSAAKIGDVAMPVLAAWAKTRNPRFGAEDLVYGKELMQVGAVGERVVAALIEQLPPGEYDHETPMIVPWLELASRGSAPELAEAMKRFEKAQDPKLVSAATAAIKNVGATK